MAGNEIKSNKVTQRIVLYIKIKLKSPLSVSSGLDNITDSDMIRDSAGNPFVPGTSLAGAMRAYLKKQKDKESFMGFSGKDKEQDRDIGRMSSLFISDLIFEKDDKNNSKDKVAPKTSVRDGVALDDNKIAKDGAKFDMEILQAGATGYFFMELTVRENEAGEYSEEKMKNEVARIIRGFQNGEIRLGSKKTRGFGQVEITKLAKKVYSKDNWTNYSAEEYNSQKWDNEKEITAAEVDEWLKESYKKQMIHINVPLRMPGGISIRQYASQKGEPDFVHITDNGKPVIPGSSMAGALRSRIKSILKDFEEYGWLQGYKHDQIINEAFGYVKDDKTAHASSVVIGETIINNFESPEKDVKSLEMVRTAISPFESSAKSGALYREKTYVDGRMKLNILVRDNENASWIIGLLMLAIKDMRDGFLAVGGQTAIGRGVLLADDKPITINDCPGKEDEYIATIISEINDKIPKSNQGGNY